LAISQPAESNCRARATQRRHVEIVDRVEGAKTIGLFNITFCEYADREHAPFGHVPPNREQIDEKAQAFRRHR
jgi:hypothetical protein